VNADQLRDQLLEVPAGADAPMSTSQGRLAVTEYCRRRGPLVIAEEVYRALVILAPRAVVRRVADQPGRAACWELTRRHPAAGRGWGDAPPREQAPHVLITGALVAELVLCLDGSGDESE